MHMISLHEEAVSPPTVGPHGLQKHEKSYHYLISLSVDRRKGYTRNKSLNDLCIVIPAEAGIRSFHYALRPPDP
jgi:hypothetical protein